MKTKFEVKDIDGNDMIIEIRLDDQCKNGHNDFAITATCYRSGKIRNDRNMLYGGCCHDEILKVRPDLKIFIDLHLCTAEGIPIHAIANGFYHITKGFERVKVSQKADYCDYYRITGEQYDILKDARDQNYFGFLLVELGIVANWKKQANEGIKLLEQMTGENFMDNSVKTGFDMTKEKLEETTAKVKEGYYTKDKIDAREVQKRKEVKAKMLLDVEQSYKKAINEKKVDFEIDKILINLFLTRDNVIFYKHTNTVVFNWQESRYNKQYTENEYKKAVKKMKANKYLKDIKFTIKKNGSN